MIDLALSNIELICPKCRGLSEGKLTQYPLQLLGTSRKDGDIILDGFLGCSNPQCQMRYPIIDGVPIIVKNLFGWLQNEFSCPPKFDSASNEVFSLQPHEDTQLYAYLTNHYGEFCRVKDPVFGEKNREYWNTAKSLIGKNLGYTLDLGCSAGRFTFELAKKSKLAVGLDSKFAAVHQAQQIKLSKGKIRFRRKLRELRVEGTLGSFEAPQNVFFLVGDALDPPFRMETFDAVSALNLIDSVTVPLILLGQMDALTA